MVGNYDGKKRVNLTDPESRKMKMKDETSRYAYTLQTVRDLKTGFTISQRITQEKNDKGALIPAIDDIIGALGKAPRYILIDNGYWQMESLEYAYMRNIMPIIPDINQSKNRNGTNMDNQYAKSNMLFDPVDEFYRCPFDRLENIGIENIKGEYKRIFKSMKCPECLFHDESGEKNYKYYFNHDNLVKLYSKINAFFDENEISIQLFIIGIELSVYTYEKLSDVQIKELEEEFNVKCRGYSISCDSNKYTYNFRRGN